MKKIVLTLWVDPSERHPDGCILTIKLTPDYESGCRNEPSLCVSSDGELSIDSTEYEIIDEKTDDDWKDFFNLEYDGITLSVKSKQKYFQVGIPKIVEE